MSLPGEDKKLTVCVHIDGERSRAALSLIDSLLATPSLGKTWDLLIAIDTPSYDLQHIIKKEYQHKKNAVFLESTERLGKARWWRVMLANIRSEYVLLLDETALPSPAWIASLFDFIRDNPAAHLCGFKYGRGIEAASPDLPYSSPLKDGAILINTAFYREHEVLPADKANMVGAQAVFFDFSMAAILGVFPDTMPQLDIASVFNELPQSDRQAPINPTLPLFSILGTHKVFGPKYFQFQS
jgi:hypothetical protein